MDLKKNREERINPRSRQNPDVVRKGSKRRPTSEGHFAKTKMNEKMILSRVKAEYKRYSNIK